MTFMTRFSIAIVWIQYCCFVLRSSYRYRPMQR